MKLKPGLANLYAIWQGQGPRLFYNSRTCMSGRNTLYRNDITSHVLTVLYDRLNK